MDLVPKVRLEILVDDLRRGQGRRDGDRGRPDRQDRRRQGLGDRPSTRSCGCVRASAEPTRSDRHQDRSGADAGPRRPGCARTRGDRGRPDGGWRRPASCGRPRHAAGRRPVRRRPAARSPTCTTPGWPTSSRPPPARTRTSRWSPSAGSAAASPRRTRTWTWSCCTAAGAGVKDVADAVWYPVWDAGVGLDHSVRTVAEALAVARDDLKAALGLLELRHLAGDRDAVRPSCTRARTRRWRQSAPRRLPELRGRHAGPLARPPASSPSCWSPTSRRPAAACATCTRCTRWPRPSCSTCPGRPSSPPGDVLLDTRGELHRRAGRALDRLVQQEQPSIAAALGRADEDDLLRAVADAGRTIAYAADTAWRQVEGELAARRRTRALTRVLPGRRAPTRSAARSPTAWSSRAARSCWPATPTRGPTRCWCCAPPAPPPGPDLPLAPHALDRLADRVRAGARRRGRPTPGTRSSTCSAPATARCRCWRRWTRPACWSG